MMSITTLVVSFLVCCMLEVRCSWAGVVSGMQAEALACSPDTTPAQPHLASNIQQNQEQNDQCGNQHYSREFPLMGIVMPETRRVYKKYNKIISGI
jgi:hypothetical protein